MNAQACRDKLIDIVQHSAPSHGKWANAGLMLASYSWVPKDDEPAAHKALLQAAIKSAGNVKGLYQAAYERRKKDLAALPNHAENVFTVKGRMIVGLGGENVMETGITLHHTYGTPVIPGSALKGLAAHYCHQVWGVVNEKFKCKGVEYQDEETGQLKSRQGSFHKVLFGSNDDSGHITFHDAWIDPNCLDKDREGLVLDVMTPHHQDYYSNIDETPPADFDDPTPITFLSVAGTFHVVVSCDVGSEPNENGQKWEGLAMDLLSKALEDWGVGGKTNAGYGRLTVA